MSSETKTGATPPTEPRRPTEPPDTGIPRRPPKPEQRPWLTPEDAQGWRVVARGSGRRGPLPLMRVLVDLDAAQSAWVREEARRAGLSPVDVLKRLIDAVRSGGLARGQ